MFIRIGQERFKASSISRFSYDGKSVSTGSWYITIWISGKEKKFSFKSEEEAKLILGYLDNAFKVIVV